MQAIEDSRFMALHKLWLANQLERKPVKRDKHGRKGDVLLGAVRHFKGEPPT